MAVYTDVSDQALTAFLREYNAGVMRRKTPIAEGVENSNYRVDTDTGQFVLTLFEKRTRKEDLPFFMGFMSHLAAHGLPVAAPVKNSAGAFIGTLAGRPAALIEFLPGRPVKSPNAEDCMALGTMLARLHEAAGDFSMTRPNVLSIDGWRKLADDCRNRADECAPGLAGLIDGELRRLYAAWPQGLPTGVVHADLFADNVLFHDGRITGVIDFYFSCTDFFAYDIAICINAWCFDGKRRLIAENARSLMSAYSKHRTLTEAEMDAFPVLLRGAALRFMLTRLYDWLNQVEGAIVTVKDPLEYRDVLDFHRQNYSSSLYGFS